MTNCKLPFGFPITLESALQTLGDRDWVKIAHNTWIIRKDNGEASVKYYLNEIIRLHQDGSYTLWANGTDQDAIFRQISDHVPVELFIHQGEPRLLPISYPGGRHMPFYDGVRVDRRGVPVEKALAAA